MTTYLTYDYRHLSAFDYTPCVLFTHPRVHHKDSVFTSFCKYVYTRRVTKLYKILD